ncbi:phage tail protein [Roseateles sp. BYS78W]|uniref:Phage tail protein n=1 Tax=Pelomonas candidula TaxID=3299025 RepID=A0ABW7HIQ3_9BURK
MSTPYVGEIRLFAGNFSPVGWMLCQGQLLPISEFETLFNLIGTIYGGDGQNSFQLPDLRGRVPVHQGQGTGLSTRTIGEVGGAETVTLSAAQLPAHTHTLLASTDTANLSTPGGAQLAATSVASYDTGPGSSAMSAAGVGSAGGAQPHENMAPTLTVNYIISLFGIFPTQN